MRMFKKLICMSQAGANGSSGGGSSDITITGDTGGPLTSNSFTFTGGTSGLVFNGAGTTETLAVNFDGVALTTANVVTETGNTLGTAAITGGTNVTIDATSTPNQIIINASGGSGGITTINGDTSNTGSSTTPTIYADNTANNCGASVLFSGDATSTLTLNVTDSKGNTHIGNVSGYSNASAFVGESTSIGYGCLAALGTSGNASAADQNTAIGYSVLAGINGSGFINYPKFNTAIGAYSGSNYTGYETNNVLINSNGVMGESNVIRISDSQSNYAPAAAAYIGGIDGVALTTANVVTEVSDQLGTAVLTPGAGITIDATSTPNEIIIELTPSSERYKESIAPISDSSAILKLQPVTFQYKPNLANISKADAASSHYGFIAEEVQKILPNLTFNDSSGQVNGVRYNEIIPLLLSEIQKLRKDVDDLKGK